MPVNVSFPCDFDTITIFALLLIINADINIKIARDNCELLRIVFNYFSIISLSFKA